MIFTRKLFELITEPFVFSTVRDFLIDVTKGLEYLEGKGLSHRDVKPANILITERQNPIATITDFGLVKAEGVTPVYCSPERFVKDGAVLGKTDIYSLGITILNCFFEKTLTPFFNWKYFLDITEISRNYLVQKADG